MMIEYLSLASVATSLGVSRSTVSRAARATSVGVFVNGRLVAVDPKDVDKLRPFIHETPGNPNWIAKRRVAPKKKRRR